MALHDLAYNDRLRARAPEQSGQVKLFIPQLPKTITLAMMREYFSQFGEGVDECVLKEKQGHSQNFGFVWAVNEATASRILMQTHVICGQEIRAPELARGRGPHRVAPKAAERLECDPSAALPGKLFVGGLAQSTTDSTLRTYFEAFGVVSQVLLPYDSVTHRSRGFGFVTFQDEASLGRVMALGQFHVLDGNRVQIKPAISKERMAITQQQIGHQPPPGQPPQPPTAARPAFHGGAGAVAASFLAGGAAGGGPTALGDGRIPYTAEQLATLSEQLASLSQSLGELGISRDAPRGQNGQHAPPAAPAQPQLPLQDQQLSQLLSALPALQQQLPALQQQQQLKQLLSQQASLNQQSSALAAQNQATLQGQHQLSGQALNQLGQQIQQLGQQPPGQDQRFDPPAGLQQLVSQAQLSHLGSQPTAQPPQFQQLQLNQAVLGQLGAPLMDQQPPLPEHAYPSQQRSMPDPALGQQYYAQAGPPLQAQRAVPPGAVNGGQGGNLPPGLAPEYAGQHPTGTAAASNGAPPDFAVSTGLPPDFANATVQALVDDPWGDLHNAQQQAPDASGRGWSW